MVAPLKQDVNGIHCLLAAAGKNYDQVVSELLKNDIIASSITTPSILGYSPLHLSAMHGYVKVVELLLNQCPEKNPRMVNGSSLLHVAVEYGHRELTEFLLERMDNYLVIDSKGI